MDRKLADILLKLGERMRTPFIQNDLTDRLLESAGKGEGLYHEFEFDLSVAHANERHEFSGDRMLVTQIDADASIRLNSIKNSLLDLKKVGFFKAPIKEFYLTNDAGSSGDLLKILVGSKGMFEPWPLKYPIEVNVRSSKLFKLDMIDLSDGTQVNSGGSDNTQTLQPPDGKIYQVIGIIYNAPDPTGSAANDHRLYVRNKYIGHAYNLIYIASNTGTAIQIRHEGFSGSTKVPTGVDNQYRLIRGGDIISSYSQPVEFYYINNTDVNQTGTRICKILVKEFDEGD